MGITAHVICSKPILVDKYTGLYTTLYIIIYIMGKIIIHNGFNISILPRQFVTSLVLLASMNPV